MFIITNYLEIKKKYVFVAEITRVTDIVLGHSIIRIVEFKLQLFLLIVFNNERIDEW